QRKSSRAKEKKQRRLEERAAMAAVCAKVEAANKLQDPLQAFPVFRKYDRNGLNVSIECCRVSGLEPSTLDWAFELTKANMQSLVVWGWFWGETGWFGGRFWGENREVFGGNTGCFWDERGRFGGGSFGVKPEWVWDKTRAVFGVKLGCFWCKPGRVWGSPGAVPGANPTPPSPLSLPPLSTQMKKVMLTVFKHNRSALQFFREALQ
ncbi:NAA40 acetyltransferase, partial [Alaudala cheleensis]|nr:NAA40 acetyltransferase [Alaudala cheleensis]